MEIKSIIIFLAMLVSSVFLTSSVFTGHFLSIVVWFLVLTCIILATIFVHAQIPWQNKQKHFQTTSSHLIKDVKPHSLTSYEKTVQAFRKMIFFENMLDLFSLQIKKIKPRTGMQIDEVAIVATIAPLYVIITIALFCISLLLTVFYSPLFLLLLSAPFFLPALPHLYYEQYVSSRRSKTDNDLPFFVQYIDTLNYVQITLPDALEMIKNSNIFSGIRSDARLFYYLVKVGGLEKMQAIYRISVSHPHAKFSKFLKMYASMYNTDASTLNNHITDFARQAYTDLEDQIKSKRNTVGPLFVMMSSAAFIGPMFLVVLLKFPTTPAELLIIMINLMPFLMTVLALSVGTIKVFTGEKIPAFPIAFLTGIPVFVVVYFLINDIYIAIGSAISVATFINWTLARKHDEKISTVESDIASSLNVIGEKIRIRVDFVQIIREIIRDRSFSKEFRQVFSGIVTELRTRAQPVDAFAKNDHPSYMMRMNLFVLYAIFVSGRANPAVLNRFSNMMQNAIDAKTKFKKNMSKNSIVMLLSPISILITYALTVGIFASMPSMDVLPGFPVMMSVLDNEAISESLKPSVLFFGICAGLIVSVSGFFSIRRTLPISIGSAVSVVTLLVWDFVEDLLLNQASFNLF